MEATVKKPRNIDILTDFPEIREFKVENLKVVSNNKQELAGRRKIKASQAQNNESKRPGNPSNCIL